VPVHELFARVDNTEPDAHTVAISQPSALSPAPPNYECQTPACVENTSVTERFHGAFFAGASADGSKVFFTGAQQLTDSATEGSNNLYEYDFSRPAGHNLIALSAGAGGVAPEVQQVAAVSADGSHVYFNAGGVLTAAANSQGQVAQSGAENLYVYERDASHPAGRVSFIADTGAGEANVTPDGRFLVFTSGDRLTPDDTSTTGTSQVFRYDAQSGELVRLSIGEHGFNDNGNSNHGNATIVSGTSGEQTERLATGGDFQAGPFRADPTMSNDGSYVFFISPVGLTPAALNEVGANNVYEWHDGNVSLISDGRDVSHIANFECGPNTTVCLLGSDATGANVFFTTVDSLVAQDTDNGFDIYDARICTGSEPCVQPPAQPAPCVGEGCHGVPAPAPSLPSAGSAVFVGAGNPMVVAPKAAVKPRSLSRAQKLAGALRVCRAEHKKKHGRAVCEAAARRRYGAVSRARSVSKSRKGGK